MRQKAWTQSLSGIKGSWLSHTKTHKRSVSWRFDVHLSGCWEPVLLGHHVSGCRPSYSKMEQGRYLCSKMFLWMCPWGKKRISHLLKFYDTWAIWIKFDLLIDWSPTSVSVSRWHALCVLMWQRANWYDAQGAWNFTDFSDSDLSECLPGKRPGHPIMPVAAPHEKHSRETLEKSQANTGRTCNLLCLLHIQGFRTPYLVVKIEYVSYFKSSVYWSLTRSNISVCPRRRQPEAAALASPASFCKNQATLPLGWVCFAFALILLNAHEDEMAVW